MFGGVHLWMLTKFTIFHRHYFVVDSERKLCFHRHLSVQEYSEGGGTFSAEVTMIWRFGHHLYPPHLGLGHHPPAPWPPPIFTHPTWDFLLLKLFVTTTTCHITPGTYVNTSQLYPPTWRIYLGLLMHFNHLVIQKCVWDRFPCSPCKVVFFRLVLLWMLTKFYFCICFWPSYL